MNRWKISLSICCAALLGSALALNASGSSILPGRPGPERIVEFAAKQLQLDPAQQAALQPIVARAVSLRDSVRADGISLLEVTRGAVSNPTGSVLVGVAERDARFDGRLAEFRAVQQLLEADGAGPRPSTDALRLAGAMPLAAGGALAAERLRDKAARVIGRAAATPACSDDQSAS